MRRFQAQNDTDALVTLGDNDYTESPGGLSHGLGRELRLAEARGRRGRRIAGEPRCPRPAGRYQFATLSMPGPVLPPPVRRRGAVRARLEQRHRRADLVARASAGVVERRSGRWRSSTTPRSRAVVSLAPRRRAALGAALRALRRPARPFGARPQLPAVRCEARRDLRRTRRRGGGLLPGQACPSGYPRRIRARREHGWLYLVFTDKQMVGWTVNVSGRRTDRFTVLPE